MFFRDQKINISKYKVLYRSIGNIQCSHFDNEKIFFNKKGFNHLVRKGKNWRPLIEQNRRLSLLKYCKSIISGEYISVEHRIIKKKNKIIHFWAFKSCIDDIYMKLIIRQTNKGPKQFFGIFPIKH